MPGSSSNRILAVVAQSVVWIVVTVVMLILLSPYYQVVTLVRWLGSRVVSVMDSGAEGPGSNRSRDAVG